MSDLIRAAVSTLSHGGGFVLVTGRQWPDLDALAEAADAHVVVPAPRARLTVCDGLRLGGRRAVATLDAAPHSPPPPGTVAVTTSAVCARAAVMAGWSVAVPGRVADVAALQSRSDLLLLGASVDEAAEDVPALSRVRVWQEGPLATLLAAGAAVPTLRRLAHRLAARGVDVTAVEVPVLDRPTHAPLVMGTQIAVGGPDAGAAVGRGDWDNDVTYVTLEDADDAELVGAVLARVPAAGG